MSDSSNLDELRDQIDKVDKDLVALINQRASLAQQIGKSKRKTGTPIYAPHREAQVLARIEAANQGPMPARTLEAIYREIMSGSFRLEQPLRIGYLGPEGTYSHLAATLQFGSSVEFDDLRAITGVFEEVARGHVDYGLVPIETTSGGGVHESLDAFTTYYGQVKVYGEVQLGIHCSLLASCEPQEIKRIYSRAEALAQCRHWLATQFPAVEKIPTESTASAAQRARDEYQKDPKCGAAAIGNALAGEIYGLHVLFEKIEDQQNNVTRFLIISRTETQPTGDDKTSMMFTTDDRPGALVDVLGVFRRANINLTHIDKRPNYRVGWDYTFFVDAVGHRNDPSFAELIGEVRAHCKELTVLGSYPRSKQVL